MASRFWFLVSVLPIGGKDRIQEQKRVFVSDINYEADWTEEVQKPKTKTRFCFSFLSDRLDRPYFTKFFSVKGWVELIITIFLF